MFRLAAILAALLWSASTSAQHPAPLYIVNGVEMESVAHIPTADIESITPLEADEETIAKYGERANEGVIIITLRYDRPARFTGGDSFNDYIAEHVKWTDHYPAARVVMRYAVAADGTLTLGETLECTDARLRKKIIAAVKNAPAWEAAAKNGEGVKSEYVLSVQLPKGKPMPKEPYIVIM